MARTKRIWREWQHPRASNGRFARKGSPEWVKAAAEKFRHAEQSLREGTHAPGMPSRGGAPGEANRLAGGRAGIGRSAKAAALFAAHAPERDTRLSPKVHGPERPPVEKAARRTGFELGPKSKLASGPDRAPLRKLGAPGSGPTRKPAPEVERTRARNANLEAQGVPTAASAGWSPERMAKYADELEAKAAQARRDGQKQKAWDLEYRAARFRRSAEAAKIDTPRDSVQAKGMTSPTTETPKASLASIEHLKRPNAKKGDLVAVETTDSTYHVTEGHKESTSVRIGVVTSTDKNGKVTGWSTHPDGSYPRKVTHRDKTYKLEQERVDVAAAMATAAANPWPGTEHTGKPYDSLAEAQAAIRPHLGDQTEKLKAARAAGPKGRDPMRLQPGDRVQIPAFRNGDPPILAEVTGAPYAYEASRYDRGTRVPMRIMDGPNAGKEGLHRFKKSEKAQVLPKAEAAPSTPEPQAPEAPAAARARLNAAVKRDAMATLQPKAAAAASAPEMPKPGTPAYNKAVSDINIVGPGVPGRRMTKYLDRAPQPGDLVTANGLSRKGTVVRAIKRNRTEGFDVAWEGSPYTQHHPAHQLQVVDVNAEIAHMRGAEAPSAPGVKAPRGPLTTRGRISADTKRAALAPKLSDAQRGNYDKLLGNNPGEGLVKHKQTRQILEQMEAHGWTMQDAGGYANYGVTQWKAPDGRTLGIQFAGGFGEKPRIFEGRRDYTFKAALEHVVTPSLEEKGGSNVHTAMEQLGMPKLHGEGWNDPGLVSRDRTYEPLQQAAKMRHPEDVAHLRKSAEHYRGLAKGREDYNRNLMGGVGGGDHGDEHSRRYRERADQFEAVANVMDRQQRERDAYVAERDRRAALPPDIRPGRFAGQAPAKKAAPKKAAPTALERVSDTIAEQRGLPTAAPASVKPSDLRGMSDDQLKAITGKTDTSGNRILARLAESELRDRAKRRDFGDAMLAERYGATLPEPKRAQGGNVDQAAADARQFILDEQRRTGGDYVHVPDVRQALAAKGHSEATQDAALAKLHDDPLFTSAPIAHGPTRAGSELRGKPIEVGGEKRHLVRLLNADRQPIGSPTASGKLSDALDFEDSGKAEMGTIRDVAKMARESAGNGSTAYEKMDRTTLNILARQAEIPIADRRGKSDAEVAALLRAKDEENKAKRAAKLNPSSVGTPSTQHEQHTPAAPAEANLEGLRPDQVALVNGVNPAHRAMVADNLRRQNREGTAAPAPAPRPKSMLETYRQHAGLTRAQFDAMPQAQREQVLADLRKVRDANEQTHRTIASNRSGFHGATIRGLVDAPHTEGAKSKLRELTYTAPPPVDNSPAGRAARAAAGDKWAIDGTMEDLQAIASHNKWGYVGSWKKDKARDYLRNHAVAHDILPAKWDTPSVADAMRGADRDKALALLDIQDADGRLTLADLNAMAQQLGVPKLTGKDKRAKMYDLAAKAKGAAPKAEAAREAAPGDPTMMRLSDERLQQGLQMYGTNTPNGRKVVAEMLRRGMNPNDVPKAPEPTPVRWINPRTGAEVPNPSQVDIVRGNVVRHDSEAGKAVLAKREAGRAIAGQNLEKARTAQREMRREELNRTTEPTHNAAKIRALEAGTIDAADLYKTANAGPSGQRTHTLVGRVRHTPDRPEGEFQITDRNGTTTGWASRTTRNGETVYSVHSEKADGGQRLEGWAGELATAADILNNGEFVARGYGADARRASSGTWEPNPTRGMSLDDMELHAAREELRKAKEHAARPELAPFARKSADREVEHRQARLDELLAERRGGGQAEAPSAPAAPTAAPTGREAKIAAKEAELEAARQRLQREGDWRPHGGMRTKSFGVRVDANLRRAGEARRDIDRLERELAALKRPEAPKAGPVNFDDIKPGGIIKRDGQYYRVTKVNAKSVKVEMPPGWDDVFKKDHKITEVHAPGVKVTKAGPKVEEPKAPAATRGRFTPEAKRSALARGEATPGYTPKNHVSEELRPIRLDRPEEGYDAHGNALNPGDTVTVASAMHNRVDQKARVLAVGIGKTGGSGLATVEFPNGDRDQILLGNLVRSRTVEGNYLDNLAAELADNPRAARSLRGQPSALDLVRSLAKTERGRGYEEAAIEREARKHRGDPLGDRLTQAAEDLRRLRRGNADEAAVNRALGRRVDTPRDSLHNGGVDNTRPTTEASMSDRVNPADLKAGDRIEIHHPGRPTLRATVLNNHGPATHSDGSPATALELRRSDGKTGTAKLKHDSVITLDRGSDAGLADQQTAGHTKASTTDRFDRYAAQHKGINAEKRAQMAADLRRLAAEEEAANAPKPDAAPRLPGEATLGVTESSKGRTTRVTLPDGTTAERTSKTMTYTHAVVGTTDLHAEARDRRKLADRHEAYAKALRQWIAEGSDMSKLKKFDTGTGSIRDREQGIKSYGYYLPGFEPTKQENGRTTWWQATPGAPAVEHLSHYRDGTQVPIPPESAKYHGPEAHRQQLELSRNRAEELRREAADLEAGPQHSYHVARWSQRADSAFKAIGSPEVNQRHTSYQVVGVGGVAKEPTKAAKVVPTAEEKAAAKQAAADAEKARREEGNRKFFADTRKSIEDAIKEGGDPEGPLQFKTEAALRSLAREYGVKLPRQPRSAYGTSAPLDRDNARKLIVEKIRGDLGKA